MRVTHSVPEGELEDHLFEHLCTCGPIQITTARPGDQPDITLYHQRLTPKEQS